MRGAALGQEARTPPGFSFTNVAAQAGLDAVTVFGGKEHEQVPAGDDRHAGPPSSTTTATDGWTSSS